MLRGALAFDDAAQAACLKSPRLPGHRHRPISAMRLISVGPSVNENDLANFRDHLEKSAAPFVAAAVLFTFKSIKLLAMAYKEECSTH